MAFFARDTYEANGIVTSFAVTFAPNFIEETDIKVYVSDTLRSIDTDYTYNSSAKTINFVTAPANGLAVRIQRETERDTPLVDFISRSVIREADLDTETKQGLYISQEFQDSNELNRINSEADDVTLQDNIDAALAEAKAFAQQLINGNAVADETVNDLIEGLIEPLTASIDDLADDNKITSVEKKRVLVAWRREEEERIRLVAIATIYGVNEATPAITYIAAYDALDTLLNVTLNLFADMSATNVVVRTTWNTIWDTYDEKKGLFENDLFNEGKDFSDTATSNAALAQTAVDNIGSDGLITANEKRFLKKEFDRVTLNKIQLLATATALGETTERAILVTKYGLLETYLNTTLDVFGDLNADTVVVSATWNTKWNEYYDQEQIMDDALVTLAAEAAAAATAAANAATTTTNAMGDDEIITVVEKLERAVDDYNDIIAEEITLTALAATVGADDTAYAAAYLALVNYIATLTETNDFTDITGPTTGIVRATWISKWTTYYDERTQLYQAIVVAVDASVTTVDNNLAANYTNTTDANTALGLKYDKTGGTISGDFVAYALGATVKARTNDDATPAAFGLQNAAGTTLFVLTEAAAGGYASVFTIDSNIAFSVANKKIIDLKPGDIGTDAINLNQLQARTNNGFGLTVTVSAGFQSSVSITINATGIADPNFDLEMNVFFSERGASDGISGSVKIHGPIDESMHYAGVIHHTDTTAGLWVEANAAVLVNTRTSVSPSGLDMFLNVGDSEKISVLYKKGINPNQAVISVSNSAWTGEWYIAIILKLRSNV